MTPHHHPEEFLLLDYITGALDRGARLVLSGHIGACARCRRAVSETEQIGGALLDCLPPTPLDPDALALALARIERPAGPAIAPLEQLPDWIDVPTEVLVAARRRRRWAAPGVWVAQIGARPGNGRNYLLGVAAGMKVPRHTHRGLEMVCVLKGAYRDGDALHGPGDFACNDGTIEHQPQITLDGECVCLVAADNALVPLDLVGRFFQPFVGI
jgi:putative transcriptional regulator